MAFDTTFARVLVTGSVAYDDWKTINEVLDRFAAPQRAAGGSFRILTGMADGADQIARMWARNNKAHLLAEPLKPGEYPEPMHGYNNMMLGWHPELVLAFKDDLDPDWASPDCVRGTEHMCRIAAEAGNPVLLNGTTELTRPVKVAVGCQHELSMHETRFGSTAIQVVMGDITTESVDVIVNAANSSLLGGGGVDGAIHRAAGPTLLEACRAVVARQGGCPTGEAVITSAGELAADHVVHTVGPVWSGSNRDHMDALLARCYTESLRLAAAAGASSIAFPNISTGVYRYPFEQAAGVALTAVETWLCENEHDLAMVRFVCFGQDNFDIYAEHLSPS